jgi:hypothetical protein
MFYVSRITPAFFFLSLLNLMVAVVYRTLEIYSWTFFVSVSFGFLASVLMGAVYQIVPNSQGRPLPARRLSYLVFLLYTFALVLLLPGRNLPGSVLMAVSVLLFSVHTLASIRNWKPVTVRLVALSVLFLALASVLLLLHLHTDKVPLQAVLHTVTVGSVLSAVYGVEMAWIPMLLMTAVSVNRAMKLFYAKVLTTPLFLGFFLLEEMLYLGALLEFGVALYFLHLLQEVFSRRQSPVRAPAVVRILTVALIPLPFGLVLGVAMASDPASRGFLMGLHADLILFGFSAFTIFGGVSHLLPRILWAGRASDPSGLTVSDLLEEKSLERFLMRGSFLYLGYLALAQAPEPLRYISLLAYALLMVLFFRHIFLPPFKKLLEVRHGGGKEM